MEGKAAFLRKYGIEKQNPVIAFVPRGFDPVYNIKTGKVVRPPAGNNITTHIVRLSGEDIEVEL